jgi:hypothetical protein
MSRTTITQAVRELESVGKMVTPPEGRIRQPGGGRKRVEEIRPGIRQQLRAIVEETTAGDPMSLLRWTSKSTRRIAEELTGRGHAISWMTVARYLQQMGYSLQANRKTREGPQHPNRDAQFRYLHRLVKRFLRRGEPVISVDTKKKELVGALKNAGRTWRPKGRPWAVHVHDFPSLSQGKAIPYGAYDIARDRAVVHVGITHDTAEFAVESIRRWWRLDGRRAYAGTHLCLPKIPSEWRKHRINNIQLQRVAEVYSPNRACNIVT